MKNKLVLQTLKRKNFLLCPEFNISYDLGYLFEIDVFKGIKFIKSFARSICSTLWNISLASIEIIICSVTFGIVADLINYNNEIFNVASPLHLLIHSVRNYLLSIYYVQGIFLGFEDTAAAKRTNQVSALVEITF